MACLCLGSECPYASEGIKMDCRICPYSDGEEDEYYMGRPGGNFVVICGNCGARGPMTDNWNDALDYWENGL